MLPPFESTSAHTLNADPGLPLPQKLWWFLLNIVNNSHPYAAVTPSMVIRDFVLTDITPYTSYLDPGSSPSRHISNLFWATLPWESIQQELGEVHIFDAGCGSGNYVRRLQAMSGQRIASYKGVDRLAQPSWPRLAAELANVSFEAGLSDTMLATIPIQTNLIISQSFIEHIEEDLRFFAQIRQFIHQTTRPVLQIHLFPTAACLPLYLSHGVRQYTPRTVSRIAALFRDNSYQILFSLGGRRSNWLHFKLITWPRLFGAQDKRAATAHYDDRVWRAIKKDMRSPQRSPAFWALVIHSNWRTKIL